MIKNLISFPKSKITKHIRIYMSDKNYVEFSSVDMEVIQSWLADDSIQFITISDTDERKHIFNKNRISYISEI